jgi:hypothetical protein
MSLSITNSNTAPPAAAADGSFKISQSIEQSFESNWVIPRRTIGNLQQFIFANQKQLRNVYNKLDLDNSQKDLLNRIAAISFYESGTTKGQAAESLFGMIVDSARAKSAPNQTSRQKSENTRTFDAMIEIGANFQKGYFGGDAVPSLRF